MFDGLFDLLYQLIDAVPGRQRRNKKSVYFEIYRSMRFSMRAVKEKLAATMAELLENLIK